MTDDTRGINPAPLFPRVRGRIAFLSPELREYFWIGVAIIAPRN
jgi:hypothetical protein